MIFLKMRIKGTRNVKTRQVILLKKIEFSQLLSMQASDFNDTFFAEKLGSIS